MTIKATGERTMWREEYAKATGTQGYLNTTAGVTKVHHVSPFSPSQAHCNRLVNLDLETLSTELPADSVYCSGCYRLMKRWEVHGKRR